MRLGESRLKGSGKIKKERLHPLDYNSKMGCGMVFFFATVEFDLINFSVYEH